LESTLDSCIFIPLTKEEEGSYTYISKSRRKIGVRSLAYLVHVSREQNWD
jgi:hypothetical protein